MDSQNMLDEMVNGDSVQILKAALPFLPSQGQSVVSVFAKFLELQNTIRFFHSSKGTMEICSNGKSDPVEMLTACSKVCHGTAKRKTGHHDQHSFDAANVGIIPKTTDTGNRHRKYGSKRRKLWIRNKNLTPG